MWTPEYLSDPVEFSRPEEWSQAGDAKVVDAMEDLIDALPSLKVGDLRGIQQFSSMAKAPEVTTTQPQPKHTSSQQDLVFLPEELAGGLVDNTWTRCQS